MGDFGSGVNVKKQLPSSDVAWTQSAGSPLVGAIGDHLRTWRNTAGTNRLIGEKEAIRSPSRRSPVVSWMNPTSRGPMADPTQIEVSIKAIPTLTSRGLMFGIRNIITNKTGKYAREIPSARPKRIVSASDSE